MKKRTSYVLSKPTIEKADAVLKQMRIEQARLNLSKSNKKLGVVVPKSLDVSTSTETTSSTRISDNNTRAKSKSKSKKS